MNTNKVFLKFLSIMFFAALIISLSPSVVSATNLIPENVRHIQTAAQLADIGGLKSAGEYYVLDNDINLDTEWVPIDDFRGTFDGQGHNVNNLYVLASSNRQYAGLFGQITVNDVVIKNVGVNVNSNGVTAIATATFACAGGLIGSGGATVENCYATGTITATATAFSSGSIYPDGYTIARAYVGGLIGSGGGTVTNCYATGSVTATASASYSGSKSVYGASTNNGVIEASADAGGLIGTGGSTVTNCYATGSVTATATASTSGDVYISRTPSGDACAGGLIGSGGATVENCYATGTITATGLSSACVGGLIGSGGTAKNCYATGSVTATATDYVYTSYHGFDSSTTYYSSVCAGGLIGCSNGRGNIVADCYATGSVTATSSGDSYAGGLIGNFNHGTSFSLNGGFDSSGTSLTVSHCYTTSVVIATKSDFYPGGAYAGGLIGGSPDNSDSVIVWDSYVTGGITAVASSSGKAYAGGCTGDSYYKVTVTNFYVTGDVTATASSSGDAYAGDLVPVESASGSIKNSYRLSTQKITGDEIAYVCDSLTSAEMQKQQSFVGWDFDTIWTINSKVNTGYPTLRGLTVNSSNSSDGSSSGGSSSNGSNGSSSGGSSSDGSSPFGNPLVLGGIAVIAIGAIVGIVVFVKKIHK